MPFASRGSRPAAWVASSSAWAGGSPGASVGGVDAGARLHMHGLYFLASVLYASGFIIDNAWTKACSTRDLPCAPVDAQCVRRVWTCTACVAVEQQ